MTGYASDTPHIAVLGAGHTGPVIARVVTEAGYPVSIAASGDPDRIELITTVLAPRAEPRWAHDAIRDADIVVLAIPLHRFASLDPALLAGKIVVDTMNYWSPTDGVQPAFEDPRHGSSEIVQHRLAGSTVVKTLNHIGYHELDEDRRPRGHTKRRALGVAGEDPTAVALVAEVIDQIGYDPVQLSRLRDGRLSPARGTGLRHLAEPRRVRVHHRHRDRVRGPGGGRPDRRRPASTHRHTKGHAMTTSSGSTTVDAGGQGVRFPLVLGLDTFGDVTNDPAGRPLSHAQTIRNLVEEGVQAEQVGADFFGIGEHHTDDFPLSAADIALAAIAARTSRIHLGSAVTVLSSDDPVRVFQRYSTLNAVSSGRAEVILGRGSSIDSFPLFGYDLADYEELFEEKAQLFAELLKGGPVTWHGKTRASLLNQDIVPHTEFGPFPAWIGVGGSPQSVIRAAQYGYSLMLAIIGGSPARFTPFSKLFQQALERLGQAPRPVGVHSPGHVAATDEQAREEFWPHYLEVIRRVSRTRGFAVPTRDSFAHEVGPHGSLYVGSPETVAQKIATNLTTLGANRFDLKYGMGGLSHEALMTNIELYGTQVIPRVRELLS